MDGTNFLKEAYYLITPLIMPTIIVASLFRFIMSFKVFDEIYLLTQGGPGTATEVVSFSIYETYFESDNIGLGSAMSVTSDPNHSYHVCCSENLYKVEIEHMTRFLSHSLLVFFQSFSCSIWLDCQPSVQTPN